MIRQPKVETVGGVFFTSFGKIKTTAVPDYGFFLERD